MNRGNIKNNETQIGGKKQVFISYESVYHTVKI